MPTPIRFLGVTLPITTRHELLLAIDEATVKNPIRVATPNPEFLELARRDRGFKEALEKMTHCLIDGFGLYLMLKLAKRRYKQTYILEHYNGATLVDDLFLRYQNGEKKFYLLGGFPANPDEDFPGSALVLAEKLRQKYPKIAIVGAESGEPVDTTNVVISNDQRNRITKATPDILLVGFGAPKQELWMTHFNQSVPVMIGVGGTFNFYAKKKRAPKLVQSIKMEWLYRLFTEPKHAKRVWRAVILFPIASLISFRRRKP